MDILDFISSWPVWLQWLVGGLILFAMIWAPLPILIIRGIRWIMNFLQPKRRGWIAMCIPAPYDSDLHKSPESDPNNAWKRDRGRWSNGKRMEFGDWYELLLDKPRSLSEITVWSQGERFPQKVKFSSKERTSDEWKSEKEEIVALGRNDQNTIFNHRFQKHQKVYGIRLQIIEPTLEPKNDKGWSPAWAIYNIDVKEYYLWGLLERQIK